MQIISGNCAMPVAKDVKQQGAEGDEIRPQGCGKRKR